MGYLSLPLTAHSKIFQILRKIRFGLPPKGLLWVKWMLYMYYWIDKSIRFQKKHMVYTVSMPVVQIISEKYPLSRQNCVKIKENRRI